MDIGKSFTFMFEDKDWIAKIGIGGLIVLFSFLIIPIPLLVGYALRVTRNVADGHPTPLPEWNDFGNMFVQGLMAIIGAIIWFIPVLILACCMVFGITTLGAATGNTDTSNASGLMGLVVLCFQCLTVVLSIALSFFVYAPITRFALNNRIETFWDFQGAWNFIRANIGNYVVAFLLALVANFIGGFGVILCFIGVIFTTFWSYLVSAHLFGQVARAASAPTDAGMFPPSPPPMDEPPSVMQGPITPASAA